MNICFKPIGYVRTQYSDEEIRKSINGVEGYVEILEEYEQGLLGLKEYSHIIVIAYLHKTPEHARKTLIVRPRRLLLMGFDIQNVPEVGVFACESPHRPNPIAISILKVTSVLGNKIYVKGLDLFNGTPVLDIKPYTPSRCIDRAELKTPKWYAVLQENLLLKTEEKDK